MSVPFTPEQEARLTELLIGAIEIAVAAGAGDTPQLLMKLDFMRLANPALSAVPRDRLLQIAEDARADAHAVKGVVFPPNFEREVSGQPK